MTNQRVIGTATSVEVQLTPTVKVAASVLAADRVRDVAVLWIDPKVLASVRPVPLACGDAAKTPVAGGDEIVTIGVPLRQRKGMTSGRVTRVDAERDHGRRHPPARQRGGAGLHRPRRPDWGHYPGGRERSKQPR